MAPPPSLPEGLLVAWYGDDYTGAAAVMEVLAFAGLASVLFLNVPTPEQLQRFTNVRGIGIAGSARSRSPAWMGEELPPVFAFLAGLNAQLFHYKICSTLDSSPAIGSIGRAAELAFAATGAPWAAIYPAAPAIGRYQAFGNLFAISGEDVHRLDRHPVMAHHPVTPMDEADIGGHLSRQTGLPFGLVGLDALTSAPEATERLARQRDRGARLMALGGATLNENRYIWWNFVSSSKDRIEEAKEAWKAADWEGGPFKLPPGDDAEFIPISPELDRTKP